jgi:hypothetical protein
MEDKNAMALFTMHVSGGQGTFHVSKRIITWKVSNKVLSHQHNANI